MALLGDILFSVRNKIPDLPPTLPAFSASSVTVVSSPGSTLPPATYFAMVTYQTNWGETVPLGEFGPLVVAANQGIQIVPFLIPGVASFRVYLTLPNNPAGSELVFFQFSSISSQVISTLEVNGISGTPPTRSTAYMLDSDGPQFGASTVYSWLNEGLSEFARASGGILDYAGVPTVAGQPMYVCPGQWLSISDVWYGGYWVQGGKRAEFFRRNTVNSSILSRVTVSVQTNQQVIEVGYQPDRTSGVTATTAAMGVTDTQVAIGNTGAFLLPFGFAQIGTEIVAYASLAGGVISGLIRSLGASTAQAWPTNTIVTELSLFWCGKRLFNIKYSPGQSTTTLQAPNGWAAILPTFMLAQAKKAEQDIKGAADLEKVFFEQVQAWYLSNKGVAKFVQVGGSGIPLTFDNTVAGGLIIPGP